MFSPKVMRSGSRRILFHIFILAISVASLHADTLTTEYGFFTAPEYADFSNNTYSYVTATTQVGAADYVYGYSNRYMGEMTGYGRTAWIANMLTKQTIAVGLSGEEFVKSYGSNQGTKASTVSGMNAAGQFYGATTEYHEGGGSVGTALWVADLSNTTARRVGLYEGGEFTNGVGNHNSQIAYGLNAGGYLAGYSTRYNGADITKGQAAWVAWAANSETHRVGLYDLGANNEFTSNSGVQSSTIYTDALGQKAWNNWGVLLGDSLRFNGGATAVGTAALWVADANSGVTRRLGLFDTTTVDLITELPVTSNFYTHANGGNHSEILGHTESGYLWGSTSRYDGTAAETGVAAWLFDTNTMRQEEFLLSVASSGASFSFVDGVLENGLAYGSFEAFDDTAFDATWSASRAFLWSNAETQILDASVLAGLADFDCAYLVNITSVTDEYNFSGWGYDFMGNYQWFDIALIPEPSTWALLLLGLGSLVFVQQRKLKKGKSSCIGN